jgi:hypothetical protein
MKNQSDQIPKIPRHGYISELAKKCNCSRRTVTRALFEGHRGPKSDMVIGIYHEMLADLKTYTHENISKLNIQNEPTK